MDTRITQQDEALDLWERGEVVAEIARRLHRSTDSVQRMVNHHEAEKYGLEYVRDIPYADFMEAV
jgi:hypothetical protein